MVNVLAIIVFGVVPLLVAMEVLRCVFLEYRRQRVPILLYHRLVAKEKADRGQVPDDEFVWVSYDTAFAEQMAYLDQAGYTTLDLDDYVAIRSGQFPAPTKPVIIVFDDGYLSNYTMAYPVLKSHGFRATIFVAPEPDEHTRREVAGVDEFLTHEQMREMSAGGISIQSHTLTHCILAELDDESARYELTESRRRLAAIVGRPVEHIAIPRAGYSPRIRRLVRQSGYKTACCNNKGTASDRSDPLALPRIVVERDFTVEDFARCLTPRAALMLRLVGNFKRIPERLGGARFARAVRNILYTSPLRPLFETRTLKRLIVLVSLAYLTGCACFWCHVIGG